MKQPDAMSVGRIVEGAHAQTVPEMYFRVASWLAESRTLPSANRICAQFHVSRATAYRWRNAWANARGIAA